MKAESKMNRCLRGLLVPCLFGLGLPCTILGKSFNGFFTLEFVRGEEAPFIPVSATATFIFGARISGELQLRELGSYRLEGIASGDLVELRLLPNDGSMAGRAVGKWANSQMDLELSFTDAPGALQARGKLQLEADTERRATPAFKVGRDLKDPSLRSWYRPGYDDSHWELVELPDDNSFGNKHPYERPL